MRRFRITLSVLTAVAATAAPTLAAPRAADRVVVLSGEEPAPAALPEPLAVAWSHAVDSAIAHPDDLGHPWVDRAAGALVVTVATERGRDLAAAVRSLAGPAVPVRVVAVRHGYGALRNVQDAVVELRVAGVAGADGVLAAWVDAERNRVVVRATHAPEALLRGLAARYGADTVAVRLAPGAVPPRVEARNNDTSPFKGGANIVVTDPNATRWDCTSGWPWWRTGAEAVITAGHCAPGGGTVATPAQSMGTIANGAGENWDTNVGTVCMTGQTTGCKGDMAFVTLYSSRFSGTAVYTGGVNSSTFKSVTTMASRRSATGDQFCTGGAVSGDLCSWRVDNPDLTTYVSTGGITGGTARNVVFASRSFGPCSKGGDSGGPVYSNNATGATAKGIHNGGADYGTRCELYYTDIWDVWDAFRGFVHLPATSLGSRLNANQSLYANQYLVSPDGRYVLRMQLDGNLVLYKPGNIPVWSTNTAASANSGAVADMQSDGNFVLYRPRRAAIWASGTNGRTGAYLTVQNDCNVVIYAPHAVWASNTQFC